MKHTVQLLRTGILAVVLTLAGCNARESPMSPGPAGGAELNSGAPSSVLQPDTADAQVDPADPKAGMNTARPDAIKDVEPAKR